MAKTCWSIVAFLFFQLTVISPPSLISAVHVSALIPKLQPTFLHFYLHDLLLPESYSNATAIPVAGPGGAGNRFFGSIVVLDDKLTETPSFFSSELGRARGIYVEDALDTQPPSKLSLLFPFTCTFTNGTYRGSISLFGQDAITEAVRELNVIGGTGDFQNARGSAFISTFNTSAGGFNVILDINVYLHYCGC